jgi:tRNA (guanine37-N1)-methyltransferase
MKSSTNKWLSPPECVKGMTQLDKNMFNKTICVPFIQINDNHLENALKCVKPFLLKLNNFNPIETNSEDNNKRIILLNPELISTIDDIVKDDENKRRILEDLCEVYEINFKDIVLTYDNFSYHSIFNAVLPSEEASVSSYSMIGHILHLNLREHVFPYKKFIGDVFLDKIKRAQIVVNKLTTIQNEFRNFQMEVLAKRDQQIETIVKTKESGVEFEFDFAEVYWNPRLSTEHERVIHKLQSNVDILYDVFAGVGPFAIPVAKRKKCEVIANDLNPECYKWLSHNCKLNKVESLVKVYNMDGRDFILNVIREDLINRMKNFDGIEMNRKYHIVMNLPALAFQFLDAFKGLLDFDVESIEHKIIPLVHCYCFVKEQNLDKDANEEPIDFDKVVKEMAQQVLGHEITSFEEIVNIRKVAPNKHMFRFSFYIPEDVLYNKFNAKKRQRIE